MELDNPLGKWYPVAYNPRFPNYKTEKELFHRDEDSLTFQVSRTKGVELYNYLHDTEAIPLQSHPICCQHVEHTFWTHRRMNISKEVLEQPPAPPGYMIYNNLLESGDYIDVGKVASDGLVTLSNKQRQRHGSWRPAQNIACLHAIWWQT